MKLTKKLFSLVLTLALLLALAAPALADSIEVTPQMKGTITIKNAVPQETYSVYKVFDLHSYDPDVQNEDGTVGTYVYTIRSDSPWFKFFTEESGKTYIEVDLDHPLSVDVENDIMTYQVHSTSTAAGAVDFGLAAMSYVKKVNAEEPNTIVPAASKLTASESKEVKFTDLPLGYYLVDSTVGAFCGLTTLQPYATIISKNSKPTLEKFVKEDSDDQWKTGDASSNSVGENSVDIGQRVDFKTVINVGLGAQNYVYHDKMAPGLHLLPETISVNLNNKNNTVDKANYAVYLAPESETVKDDREHETCTFEIAFKNEYVRTLDGDPTPNGNETEGKVDQLIITYSAVAKSTSEDGTSVVIGSDGNPNEGWLDYGDGSKTPPDKTVTYVWYFDIFKYARVVTGKDAQDQNVIAPKGLPEAKFKVEQLTGNDDDGNPILQPIAFVDVTEDPKCADHKQKGYKVYRANTSNMYSETTSVDDVPAPQLREAGAQDYIVSGKEGKIHILGLDAGTYYVTEIEAPAGYNLLDHPLVVTIGEDGNVTATENGTDVNTSGKEVPIENKAGSLLPTTGGMGTTLFYIVGAALMLVAVVLLVVKRRMKADEE